MPTSKELWSQVCQCRSLANASADALSSERLKLRLYRLITEAVEAEDCEARLLQGEKAQLPSRRRLS